MLFLQASHVTSVLRKPNCFCNKQNSNGKFQWPSLPKWTYPFNVAMRINLWSPWFERCAIGKWSYNLGFLTPALFQPWWECAYTKGRLLGTCGDLTTFSAAWTPMLQRTCCFHYLNLSTIAACMPTIPSRVLHDSPNAPHPGRRNTELIVILMFSRPKMFHSQLQLCIIKYDPFPDLFRLDHRHKTDKKDSTLIKSTPLAACSLASWADWPSGWSMWYSWTRLVASSILRMKELNITKGFSTASVLQCLSTPN